jgi:hypothetical protein
LYQLTSSSFPHGSSRLPQHVVPQVGTGTPDPVLAPPLWPVLPRPNRDMAFFTFALPHLGHSGFPCFPAERTNNSNVSSQSSQRYSYTGILSFTPCCLFILVKLQALNTIQGYSITLANGVVKSLLRQFRLVYWPSSDILGLRAFNQIISTLPMKVFYKKQGTTDFTDYTD